MDNEHPSPPFPYEDWGNTPVLTFTFRETDEVCTIHSGLVEKLAPKFRTFISEKVEDPAKESFALSKTDVETFRRFASFAYTGMYYSEEPQRRPLDSSSEGEEESMDGVSPSVSSPEAELPEPTPAIEQCCGLSERSDEQMSSLHSDDPFEMGMLDPNFDYSGTLLSHVKVLVFAQKTGHGPLIDLSLRHVEGLLKNVWLQEDTCEKLIDLIKYVFNNTQNKQDAQILGAIIVYYAASEIRALKEQPAFRDLLSFADFMLPLIDLVIDNKT